ncbi:MAG TPA: methyl-accepting chemotaxis protein [Patescibacteria group bacterium]
MNLFKNLTVGKRVALGAMALIVLIILGTFFSIRSLTSIERLSAGTARIVRTTEDALLLDIYFLRNRVDLNNYIDTADPAFIKEIQENRTFIEQTFKELLDQEKNPALLKSLDEFESIRSRSLELADQIIAAVNSQAPEEQINLLFAESRGLSNKSREILSNIIDFERKAFSAALEQTASRINNLKIENFIFFGGVIFIALIIFIILFRSTVPVIVKAVDRTSKAASGLASSSQQAASASQQVASVSQQVASGATQQSQQAEEVSKSLAQMAANIQQMSASSQEVSATSTKVAGMAQIAGEKGEQSQKGLTKINAIIGDASNMIKTVSGRTDDIRKIVEIITSIAEQTNLLALNAAIEAARAGEAGRGFAVVADEVRKLAEGASKASAEIKDKIKEMISQIQNTVNSVEGGKKTAEESGKIISDTLSNLQEIAAGIQQVSSKTQELSAAVTQQSSSVQQVAKTMDSIAAVAVQNASGAQQLSASTQQQSAANQQVASTAQELLSIARRFAALVGSKIDEAGLPSRKPMDELAVEQGFEPTEVLEPRPESIKTKPAKVKRQPIKKKKQS